MMLFALVLIAGLAFAHNTWLYVLLGRTSEALAGTSDGFCDSEIAPRPERIAEATVVTVHGKRSLHRLKDLGKSARFQIPEAVTEPHVLGLRLTAWPIQMEPDAFRGYLEHENASEHAHLVTDEVQIEHYTKLAKALPPATGFAEATKLRCGHRLEIIPIHREGDHVLVQLLAEGEPLSGSLVRAFRWGTHDALAEQVTDANGEVKLEIPNANLALVRAHCFVRLGPTWESLWTSLTFYIPERSDAGGSE